VLLVAIIKYLIGWLAKSKWSNFDTMLNRLTPISLDIQWLLGIILWIAGTYWIYPRNIAWEHPITLTVAVIVAHFFSARVGRATTDPDRYRTAFVGYLITGLVVMLGVYTILGNWNVFGSN
jgi:hypothetical protein